MSHIRDLIRRVAGLAVVVLTATWCPGAAAQQSDPVEELRQELLRAPLSGEDATNQVVLDHREMMLRKRSQALKTLIDLRRGLQLTEWQDDADPTQKTKLRLLDEKIRAEIGQRFAAGETVSADF